MGRICFSFIFASLLSGLWVARANAGLNVNAWIVGTGVREFGSGAYAEASTTIVSNPFDQTFAPSLGNSFSRAEHHFAWSGDSGSFDVTLNHRLASLRGDAGSEGRIFFNPSVDSILQFDGAYGFSWPGSTIGTTLLGLTIANSDNDETILSAGQIGGNHGLGPPFGMLSIHESVYLPAGINYVLVYATQMNHINPTPPGTFGDANANILFTLTPVPEPAAIALLLLAATSIRPRKK